MTARPRPEKSADNVLAFIAYRASAEAQAAAATMLHSAQRTMRTRGPNEPTSEQTDRVRQAIHRVARGEPAVSNLDEFRALYAAMCAHGESIGLAHLGFAMLEPLFDCLMQSANPSNGSTS